MKARDVLVVGAVAVVVGIAAADALRGEGGGEDERAAAEKARGDEGAVEQGAADAPSAPFHGIPARGLLVFSDSRHCRMRAVAVASGREPALPRLAGDCSLWASPVAGRVAYGLGGGVNDSVPFRLVELDGRRTRSFGGYSALFGVILFSRDGRRAAWCGGSRRGFDLELGGRARRLSDCPTAYTPDGEIASARGDRLVVGGRTVARSDGTITLARWGLDGSLALVVEGRRIVVRRGGGIARVVSRPIPPALEGGALRFAPDNCAVLVGRDGRFRLLPLGCWRGGPRRNYYGTDVAWSPDGRWLAVAEEQTIAFHRVVGPPALVRWLASAAELDWQGGG